MTNLQEEFLPQEYEDLIRNARAKYMRPGPDYPMEDLENAQLGEAARMLEPIQSVRAQEVLGWIGVEQMFQFPDNEVRRTEALERAKTAFGWTYDQYDQTGYELRMGRLGVVASFLPVYERLASREPIDDELRNRTLGALASASEIFLQNDIAPPGMTNEARLETILLLSRLGRRGDTRKPVSEFALPATLRQRVGHLPKEIETKHGRYNWDVSMLRRQGDVWSIEAGFSVESWQKNKR